MIDTKIDDERVKYLERVARLLQLDYSTKEELNKLVMKKCIDYAFTKEFTERVEEEKLREMHPGLKDCYEKYQMMLALTRKEENE